MRTFRDVILQAKDFYGMYEYKVARERIIMDVIEILFPNAELDPEYIANAKNELSYIINKESITRKYDSLP